MVLIVSRKVERAYPLAVAVAGAAAFYFSTRPFPSGEGVLSAGLTIGAIFTAFIATNKSLILTLDTKVMKKLRESDWYSILISYLRAALWSSFAFSVFSLAGYFAALPTQRWLAALWIGNALHMILSFHRVTSILLTLVNQQGKGR